MKKITFLTLCCLLLAVLSYAQKVEAYFKAYVALKVTLMAEAKAQKIEKKEGEYMKISFTELNETYEIRYLENKNKNGFALFGRYNCDNTKGTCSFSRMEAYELQSDGSLKGLDQKYFTEDFLKKLETAATSKSSKLKNMDNVVLVGKMPNKGSTVLEISFFENINTKSQKEIKVANIIYDAVQDVFNVVEK